MTQILLNISNVRLDNQISAAERKNRLQLNTTRSLCFGHLRKIKVSFWSNEYKKSGVDGVLTRG